MASFYTVSVFNVIRHVLGVIQVQDSVSATITLHSLILQLGDVFGFILGSVLVIFHLPHVYSRKSFFTVLTAVSTVSILVVLPAYLVGDYTIITVYVNTYTNLEPFRQLGTYIPAMSSIWDDANAMSKITVAGIFGPHYLYIDNRSAVIRALLAFNVLGLVLANSKMSIIDVICAYSVHALYRLFMIRTTYAYLVAAGTLGVSAFPLILLGFGSDSLVSRAGFSGRVELWQASLYTIS